MKFHILNINITGKIMCIVLFFLFIFQDLKAQTEIEGSGVITTRVGTVINFNKIHKVTTIFVTYEREGSLHDIEIERIRFIETATQIITFDEKNNPRIESKIRTETKPAIDTAIMVERPNRYVITTEKGKETLVKEIKRFNDAGIDYKPWIYVNLTAFSTNHKRELITGGIGINVSDNIMIHQEISWVYYWWDNWQTSVSGNGDGIAFATEVRRYFNNSSSGLLIGTYIAPYGVYKKISISENFRMNFDRIERNYIMEAFGGGIVAGHNLVYRSHLTLDYFAGFGLQYYYDVRDHSDNFTEPVLNLGLRIGVTF